MAIVRSSEAGLSRRRVELDAETRWLRLAAAEIGAGFLLAALGFGARAAGRPAQGWWLAAAIMVVLGGGHLWKVTMNRRESRALRYGARGEGRAADVLARLFDDQHSLFNDLTIRHGMRTAQVDHLVIGPTGVWVIETKNWHGRVEGDAEAETWTQTRPNQPKLRLGSPVRQNRRHVAVLKRWLEARGFRDVPIRSMVLFLNPDVDLSILNLKDDEPVGTLAQLQAAGPNDVV